jgi:uncharacterized hydrophobic protein (TIGR00271 family)
MQRTKIRDSIRTGASFDRTYVLMNVLAAIIASYGLLANSVAVIIGAMIVAMLIGPIIGISLGLVEVDVRLARSSVLTLASGMALVYVTAFVIGLIHREIPVTTEILARTSPTFLDLMVAIAGGAAGAYAAVSSRLSMSVVGVAVATALVPPLCASSILLSRGEGTLAFGGLVLTFVNIVAIQFSSAVVLWLAGFRGATRRGSSSLRAFLLRGGVSMLLVAVLAGFMVLNLERTVSNQLFRSRTEQLLRQAVERWSGAYLAEVRYETADGEMMVLAVVRGPTTPTPQQVRAAQETLPSAPGLAKTSLRVRYLPVQVITPEGEINAPDNLVGAGQ